jgi:hypothetical protein
MQIPAVALTRETLGKARRDGRKIFDEIRRCEWQAVMVSPETLSEASMSIVLADTFFRQNFLALPIDEFHLIGPWGKSFRSAFHQLASVLWRLPPGTPVIGASATVLPGKPFDDILGLLRISSNYKVIRESNERPNIRSAALRLSHGLGGARFPDVSFAAVDGQKAVIYCEDLSLTFRVATYLRRLLPAGDARFTRIRQWTSLTEPEHNAETIRCFRDDPSTTAIVATIAFGMGMNALRNIRTVGILGAPSSMDNYKQEEGRAVRDLVTAGTGIVYIQNTIWDRLRDGKALGKRRARPGQTASAEDLERVDAPMLRYLRACVAKRCLIAEQNGIYENPGPDASKSCIQARRRLPCSSCQRFLPPPSHANAMPAASSLPPTDSFPALLTPYKTNEKDRNNVRLKLRSFARERWGLRPRSNWIPFEAFWPGNSLDLLAHHFHRIRSPADLGLVLASWPEFLRSDGEALLAKLGELTTRMDDRARRKKVATTAKMLATKARKKGTPL